MDITVLRTFLAIIDEGSFAAGARRMGISRSMCSKNIADLEQELGARLLVRTTRAVHTTPIGQVYADQLRDALARLDAANENVRAIAEKPTGMLKIGAPIAYTMKILQPHLLRFMEQYPDIQMQLQLDDGTSDVIGQGFDAVIRIGLLQDSSLIGRRIHHADLKIVASPGYVKEHGAPKTPRTCSSTNVCITRSCAAPILGHCNATDRRSIRKWCLFFPRTTPKCCCRWPRTVRE